MAFSIRNHRLYRGTQAVETIRSPYTSGAFAQPPRFLVIHYTEGESARSSAEWFGSPDNDKKTSAHLVIDRDGAPIQCVDFGLVAHHAGTSAWKGYTSLNYHAIGIELANWGPLRRRTTGWATPRGTIIADPILAVHRNGNPHPFPAREPIGWEPFPAAQFDALVAIAATLMKHYGLTEIVGHDDIAPVRKSDPGPAFDMGRLRNLVTSTRAEGGDGSLVVSPAEGLNLRSGPGVQHPVLEMLAAGTRVRPIESDGRWYMVSVLGADGAPRRTGWVHSAYLD